jgi:hypothetical protein
MRTLVDLADAVVPAVFEKLNKTGNAGHCILVARVLDQVIEAAGVPSMPMCVDYEILNPSALRHVEAGGSLGDLNGDAFEGRTGTGSSRMYDHHVVTIIPQGKTATLLDPAIVQVTVNVPGASLPPLVVAGLPYPVPEQRGFVINGHLLTYTFHPAQRDFIANEQWTDEKAAAVYALRVIGRLGIGSAGEYVRQGKASVYGPPRVHSPRRTNGGRALAVHARRRSAGAQSAW